MRLITESLHQYTPALFMDQFGNYVVQCCLRFGAPWTDFIFESMMEKLWETAQGRFGARAMRACLESHSATKEQQVYLLKICLTIASYGCGYYSSQRPSCD
jgi:protein JSN1